MEINIANRLNHFENRIGHILGEINVVLIHENNLRGR